MSIGSMNEDNRADTGISDTVKKYGPAAAFDMSVPVTVAGILGQYFGTSYGPRGSDKLIYDKFDNYLLVSNDGGHILEALTDLNGSIAADFIMKWGRSISRRLGDGVKLYFILTGELCNSLNKLAGEGINRRLLSEAASFISVLWRYFTDIFALRWDRITVFESLRNFAQDLDVRNTVEYTYRKRYGIGQIIDSLALNPLKGKLSAANARILADIALRAVGEFALYVSKITDNDNVGGAASVFSHFVEVRGLKSIVNRVGIIGPSFNRSFFGKFAVISKEPVNITVADGVIPGWINLLMVKRKLYTDLPDGGSFAPSGPPFEFISEDPETPDIFRKYETGRSKYIFNLFVKDIKPDLIITEKGVERTFESLCTKNGILLIRRADPDEFGRAAEFLGITPLGEGELKPRREHIKRVYAAYLEMGNKNLLTLYKDRTGAPKTSDKDNPDRTGCNGLLRRARISVGTVILTGTLEFTVEAVKKLFDKVLYTLSDFVVKGAVLPDAGCTESAFGLFLKKLSPLLAGEPPRSDLSEIVDLMGNIIPCFSEEMKKTDTFRSAVDFLGDYINNHTIKLRTKLAYIIDSVAECFHTPLKLLITNSGSDPFDILPRVISLINIGVRAGYNSEERRITDCMKEGLFTPVTFKFLPVLYALKTCSLIFGTDRVIRADKFGKIGR